MPKTLQTLGPWFVGQRVTVTEVVETRPHPFSPVTQDREDEVASITDALCRVHVGYSEPGQIRLKSDPCIFNIIGETNSKRRFPQYSKTIRPRPT